jgi:uncharacterized membrane protein HdeD (DUF308 family)
LLLLGGTSVVLGALMMFWPDITVAVVAVLVGIQLLIHGGARLLQSFTLDGAGVGARILLSLLGLISIVLGVLALRHLLQTVAAVALIVGLFWLMAGVLELLRGFGDRTNWSAVDIGGGVLAVLAGIVLLCWPKPTVLVLAVLTGAWFVLSGLLTIVSAVRADRRLRGIDG